MNCAGSLHGDAVESPVARDAFLLGALEEQAALFGLPGVVSRVVV